MMEVFIVVYISLFIFFGIDWSKRSVEDDLYRQHKIHDSVDFLILSILFFLFLHALFKSFKIVQFLPHETTVAIDNDTGIIKQQFFFLNFCYFINNKF